ncbi:Uncharacterised protein [Klebsiella pneumoniae]|nr:Uncharacterised protein [Klebsiella pneumoniae]
MDETTVVNFNTCFISRQQFTIRGTADSHQNCVVTLWFCRAFLAFHCDIDTVFFGFNGSHFGFQHQVKLRADTFGEQFNDIFVCRRNDLVKHFNNINL